MNYFLFNQIETTHLTVCGYASLNPGWSHMARNLPEETVLIIGKKNSTYISDEGQEYAVEPGTMLLLPAGRFHKGTKKIDKNTGYYWFHFLKIPQLSSEKESLQILGNREIAKERLKNNLIIPQTLRFTNPDYIMNVCSEILTSFNSPDFSYMEYDNLFIKLLLEIQKETINNLSEKNREGENTLVDQLIAEINKDLCIPDASVKYFSGKLKVNADYLGRVFKKTMGISVGQYISKKRIDLACIRLRESNDSIEDIYIHTGFYSKRQFYHEFKNVTDKTPASYRKNSAYTNINVL